MRREAEWTLNPVTEREIAEDRRQEGRQLRSGGTLALAALGMCPLACLGPCATATSGAAPWIPIALLVAPLGAFGLALRQYLKEAERGRRLRAARRQEFAGIDGWIVELSVHQGETISGRDTGIVWFEDGRLYFAGARTSFGLGLDDTAQKALEGPAVVDSGPQIVLPLRTATAVGPVSLGLRFAPPELGSYEPQSRETSFRSVLRDWFATGVSANGQLPPLRRGFGLAPRWTLQMRAVVATVAWPGLAVAIAGVGAANGPAAIVLAMLGVPALALWPSSFSPRRGWRALRDRRRLDASE